MHIDRGTIRLQQIKVERLAVVVIVRKTPDTTLLHPHHEGSLIVETYFLSTHHHRYQLLQVLLLLLQLLLLCLWSVESVLGSKESDVQSLVVCSQSLVGNLDPELLFYLDGSFFQSQIRPCLQGIFLLQVLLYLWSKYRFSACILMRSGLDVLSISQVLANDAEDVIVWHVQLPGDVCSLGIYL